MVNETRISNFAESSGSVCIIEQEEFETFLKSQLEHCMPDTELLVMDIIENMRACYSSDIPMSEVHIVLRNIPCKEDMYRFLDLKYEKKRTLEEVIKSFDEAEGMREIGRINDEWDAKHANDPPKECEATT